MSFKFRQTRGGLLFIACLIFPIFGFCSGDSKVSDALSHYIMGAINDNLGQPDKAIEEFKKAIAFDSKSSVLYLDLALEYLKKGDTQDAIKELKLVTEIEPELPQAHEILALLYASQNKPDLATGEYEIALKQASKLSPKNTDIYKALAVIYLQQKKIKSAEDTYKLVLELSPNDPQAHFYLGSIYNELNNKEEAVKELKKAIASKPDFAEALNYLGYMYAEEGKNLDPAEKMIKKAITLDLDNGAYIDSLGWLYFRKGKFKEAVKELEAASRLMDDPVILDHLKQAKEKINK